MSKLYVVATPIGNLQDITLRALQILREVNLVLAEDTRITRKLLSHFNIQKPLFSFHQHSSETKMQSILEWLEHGKDIALVSDAGTPGINDPGGKLIASVTEKLPEVQIVPIPGPSAFVSALSISGVNADRFLFLGFVPHKKGRQKFFRQITKSLYPAVFYESKHRIVKTLTEIARLEELKKRPLMAARELTKLHETIYRGTAEEIIIKLGGNPKGEFVVVIATNSASRTPRHISEYKKTRTE